MLKASKDDHFVYTKILPGNNPEFFNPQPGPRMRPRPLESCQSGAALGGWQEADVPQ
jgi:hypothetical protein